MINLSSHVLTADEVSMLSKGLKWDTFETIKDLQLYTRKLLLRSIYDKETFGPDGCRSICEQKALTNLNALLKENDSRDLIDTIDLEAIFWEIDNPPTDVTKLTTHSKLKKKIGYISFYQFQPWNCYISEANLPRNKIP